MNCFVKESSGRIWHFYHNEYGICCCVMKGNKLSDYTVLVEDGGSDFDLLIDDANCIHMVFQNRAGDIMYANHVRGRWRKTTLLESKNPVGYQKDFVIKRWDNVLNIFYCIDYGGKRMLVHQVIDGICANPRVIDCIKGDFTVTADLSGNPVLMYYSETHKSLGTIKYVLKKGMWEAFLPRDKLSGCKNPFLFVDADGVEHFLYEKDYCIYEFCKGARNFIGVGKRPIMLYQDKNIIIWEDAADNKIYVKSEMEVTPTIIMSGFFLKPFNCAVRYTSYEKNIIADRCFCSITDGTVKMYGLNDFIPLNRY